METKENHWFLDNANIEPIYLHIPSPFTSAKEEDLKLLDPSDSFVWDEPPPQEILSLLGIVFMVIPRYIPSDNITRIKLHGFSDASHVAYGAVYIHIRKHSFPSMLR